MTILINPSPPFGHSWLHSSYIENILNPFQELWTSHPIMALASRLRSRILLFKLGPDMQEAPQI